MHAAAPRVRSWLRPAPTPGALRPALAAAWPAAAAQVYDVTEAGVSCMTREGDTLELAAQDCPPELLARVRAGLGCAQPATCAAAARVWLTRRAQPLPTELRPACGAIACAACMRYLCVSSQPLAALRRIAGARGV